MTNKKNTNKKPEIANIGNYDHKAIVTAFMKDKALHFPQSVEVEFSTSGTTSTADLEKAAIEALKKMFPAGIAPDPSHETGCAVIKVRIFESRLQSPADTGHDGSTSEDGDGGADE